MSDRYPEALAALESMDGWDALDLDHPQYANVRRIMAEDGEARAKVIRECFRTDAGKQTLRWLMEFLIQPASPPGSPEGYGFFREGQNDVVRQILQNIELASRG